MLSQMLPFLALYASAASITGVSHTAPSFDFVTVVEGIRFHGPKCMAVEPVFDLEGYNEIEKQDFYRRFNASQAGCPSRHENNQNLDPTELVPAKQETEVMAGADCDFSQRFEWYREDGQENAHEYPCLGCTTADEIRVEKEECRSVSLSIDFSLWKFISAKVGGSLTQCKRINAGCRKNFGGKLVNRSSQSLCSGNGG